MTAGVGLAAAILAAVFLWVASNFIAKPWRQSKSNSLAHSQLYFVVALAFNAAAYANVCQGGRHVTANSPVSSSVFLVIAAIVVMRSAVTVHRKNNPLWLACSCCLFAAILFTGGVWRHLQLAESYAASAAAGSHYAFLWRIGVAINCGGVLVHSRIGLLAIQLSTANPSFGRMFGLGLLAVTVYLALKGGLQAPAGSESSDCAPWQPHANARLLPRYGLNHSSTYLTMRDGVRIATDIYLPDGPGAPDYGTPLPTILHITRYNRALRVKFPWNFVLGDSFNTRSGKYVDKMVKTRGYAFVSIDTRGSGASFGKRPFDLAPTEVRDHQEVLEWVLAQPWCNGRVGTGGISYDGMSAFRLASGDKFSAVRATALMFSPMDPFTEILAPGGLLDVGFFGDYTLFTGASERNVPVTGVTMPLVVKLLSNIVTDGVAPVVPNDPDGDLAAAVAEHHDNWNMADTLRGRHFIDETFLKEENSDQELSALNFIPEREVFERLAHNGVATMVYGGYYDSGSVRGSIDTAKQLHKAGAHAEVTIGPWTHGARQTCSPWNSVVSTAPCFDVFEDVATFWDTHLSSDYVDKDLSDNVRVFTLGSESWETREEWPAVGEDARSVVFALEKSGELRMSQAYFEGVPSTDYVAAPTSSVHDRIRYHVDFNATSGVVSRWNLVQSLLKQPVDYADREQQGLASLLFTTVPLLEPITLSGPALLSLFLTPTDGTDAAVFAYLDVIDDSGDVVYLTEGQIRAAHSPALTFREADFQPLEPQKRRRVDVWLEPISVLLQPGWRLRLAITGADVDNFWLDNIDAATAWDVDPGSLTSDEDALVSGSGLILQIA